MPWETCELRIAGKQGRHSGLKKEKMAGGRRGLVGERCEEGQRKGRRGRYGGQVNFTEGCRAR